jgi:hypothetical protein
MNELDLEEREDKKKKERDERRQNMKFGLAPF